MAKIYLKKGEIIEISEQEAEQLQYNIDNKMYKYSDFITIRGQSIRFGNIDRVVPGPKATDDITGKEMAEWHKKRREFAAKDPEYKAKKFIDGPALLFFSVAGRSSERALYDRAVAFYKENPKRAWPNGSIFMGLWTSLAGNKYDAAGLKILDRTLAEDAQAVLADEEFARKIAVEREKLMAPVSDPTPIPVVAQIIPPKESDPNLPF